MHQLKETNCREGATETGKGKHTLVRDAQCRRRGWCHRVSRRCRKRRGIRLELRRRNDDDVAVATVRRGRDQQQRDPALAAAVDAAGGHDAAEAVQWAAVLNKRSEAFRRVLIEDPPDGLEPLRVRQDKAAQAAPARPRTISPDKAESWLIVTDFKANNSKIESAAMPTPESEIGWISKGAHAVGRGTILVGIGIGRWTKLRRTFRK